MVTTEKALNWFSIFEGLITENKSYLSELDAPIGDGDHGNNMYRGVVAMKEDFETKNPQSPADVFKIAAMAMISKVGGASGPLYGTAFLEMSKAMDKTEDLSEIIEAGYAGIVKRGKAELGEKTMLDVWHPVIAALKTDTFSKTIIDEAVLATKPMRATKGRATYLGERSIGHLDPGSASSGYFFTAMVEALAL